MRIILIHQAFASPDEPGGTRHYEFARYCVQEGHEFTIVASDVNYATGKRVDCATEQNLDGIRILRARTSASLHRSYAWRAFAFLVYMVTSFWKALRAGPVDIVMGTSPPIFQALSACLLAALRRRPFLLEIRDLYVDGAIEDGILRSGVLIAMARRLEHFLLNRATHILVNSPAYHVHFVEKRGVPPDKISVIPNGVDPDMFEPDAKGDTVRRELGLDGKFLVMYAGALGISNSILTLLEAAARLRDDNDIHLVLVGDGKERTHLEAQAKELKLDNVTFTGARPKAEMQQFLAAADVCVATLSDTLVHRTTYPNKVFDYMAAARPIVLGIEGVICDVVQAAQCGICTPQADAEAIADAVENLSQDRERAVAMGRAGREYVAEHFDRRQHAEEFVKLLGELAGTA